MYRQNDVIWIQFLTPGDCLTCARVCTPFGPNASTLPPGFGLSSASGAGSAKADKAEVRSWTFSLAPSGGATGLPDSGDREIRSYLEFASSPADTKAEVPDMSFAACWLGRDRGRVNRVSFRARNRLS